MASALPGEEAAALEWLQGSGQFDVRTVQLADLASARVPLTSLLWWHYADAPELPSSAMQATTVRAVRNHIDRGGHLLLTLFAVTYLLPLELETVAPNQVETVLGSDFARWGPEDQRVLAGLQSYRGHPLLRRFWGGTFAASIDKEARYAVARYRGDVWPASGAVVAVGKRYIGIDRDHKVAVEYRPSETRPGGRVLAIGESLYFSAPDNRNRRQLELLAEDALDYLAGELPPAPIGATIPSTGAPTLPAASTMAGDEAAAPAPPGVEETTPTQPAWADLPDVLANTSYWTPRDRSTRGFAPVSTVVPEPVLDPSVLTDVSAARSGLALETTADPATPFDLYSPRVLLTGRQNGLIEDLWAYPLRVARNLRFAIIRDGATVEWLDAPSTPASFVARPEGHTVRTSAGDSTIALHLAVPRDRGGMLALLELDVQEPVRIIATWEIDDAPMWPREADVLGDLQVGWDEGAHAVVWRDPSGSFAAYGGFGRAPTRVLIDVTTEELDPDPKLESDAEQEETTLEGEILQSRRVAIEVRFDPARDAVLAFAIGSGFNTTEDGRDTYSQMLTDPVAVWTANANYYRQFLDRTLDIATPDPTFNEAFLWAKVGLDAFRMTTPGMGTGLLAGFAASQDPATDPWAVENSFLRRPGYGWYFGRDAIWSSFAADAYGGTDLTAEALRFLARYQDVDGKILHEITPSWSIHYDAADSTPLFLLGLEHHVRTTGDRDLLRTLWPTVRRAMAFLETTDTDGDGLIENTGVGHGWIEGGKFFGAHTTFYLASLWAATLEAVERLATWMADDELAESTGARVASTRDLLNTEFWDDAQRSYHHGKRADGTFISARTVMPAVPMIFGLLDEARVRPVLDFFGGGDINADWGARMAQRSNPDYDPAGYHSGMVWPLYSGWSALAGYRYHRPLAAYLQLAASLRLYRHGNLGYIPEALHGDRFEPAGVTSHQAWSQAAAILPAVEGLLGIRPDALEGRLRIHPHLPGGWNEVVAQPVRVGEDAFRVTVTREPESTSFLIERLAGANPIELELSLPFPRSVLVNLDRDATSGAAISEGETIVDHPSEKEAVVRATMTEPTATITFRHSPYPQVVQTPPNLQPGQQGGALRVIDTRLTARTMTLRVEGMPGQTYRLNLATPWPVASVTGLPRTSVLVPGPGRATLELVFPGTAGNYQRADITVEFRR